MVFPSHPAKSMSLALRTPSGISRVLKNPRWVSEWMNEPSGPLSWLQLSLLSQCLYFYCLPWVGEGGWQDPGWVLVSWTTWLSFGNRWATSPLAGHVYMALHTHRGPFLGKISLKSQKWAMRFLSYQWDRQLSCPYWEEPETLSIFGLEGSLKSL